MTRTITNWRKSSRSGAGGSNCVEVGVTPDRAYVGVRDTKDRSYGTLEVPASSWRAFLGTIKAGKLG